MEMYVDINVLESCYLVSNLFSHIEQKNRFKIWIWKGKCKNQFSLVVWMQMGSVYCQFGATCPIVEKQTSWERAATKETVH